MNKPLSKKETGARGHAYAKVNLTLDVLGTMPDGYHELISVMHEVFLYDDVFVRVCEIEGENQVAIEIHGEDFTRIIPTDRRNTAAAAAYAFLDALGVTGCHVEITVDKKIPVGAGLGGGSADAAEVLRLLNVLFDRPFYADRLCEIGATVGSDVPFCVEGGTMLARGRGERLTRLPAPPNHYMVIVKPNFSVSTAALFYKIDSAKISARPDTQGMIEALRTHDLPGVAYRIFNVFEEVLPSPQRGEITAIKSRLLDLGALSAAMTGTGSAVFGIFDDSKVQKTAFDTLSAEYDDCFECGTMREFADVDLVLPTQEHAAMAMDFVNEFLENEETRIPGSAGLHHEKTYFDWLEKLARWRDRTLMPEGRTPSTTFFAVHRFDGHIVGIIDIRHRLNNELRIRGGHIGFSIRPSERGNGYARRMLAEALGYCRRLSLKRVLLTCDKSNPACTHVIMKNGGMLDSEVPQKDGVFVQRYWIEL